ncbi:MAG: methyl-accepting chemotaxis protein [Lachnospiraceae bacterium]|nr:methyl-accepting chemotaxis protein [Lachnospiraceae bacterium]
MSLKRKILFSMIGSAIIASLICGIASIFVSSRSTREMAKEQLDSICRIHQMEVDSKLAQIENSVNMLADNTVAQIEDFERFKTDEAYVGQCTEKIREFAKIAGENTEGVLTYYIRYNPDFTPATSGLFASKTGGASGFEYIEPTDFSGYDKDDLEHVGWYYIPVNNGKPTWMEPYQNENINVYMISYVVPLFIGGEAVGIVGMDIDFTTIQEKVNSISVYTDGYAFLASASNEILAHPSEDYGKNIAESSQELADFMSAHAESQDGQTADYTYQDKGKVAAVSVLRNGMRLAVTVPDSEFNSTSGHLFKMIIVAFLFALLFSVCSGLYSSSTIARPIKNLTKIIVDTANLDLKPNPQSKKLVKLKDETGDMARAVRQMRKKFREMVALMEKAGSDIGGNVTSLHQNMSEISGICENNSATTQELAAAMEEASSAVETVSESARTVEDNMGHIGILSREGAEKSAEVKNRADNLKQTTLTAAKRTQEIYGQVKEKTSDAIRQAQAVEQINELTHNIRDISSQINLLSLNASIEAARAGDAGHGFAVVASEIGTLAGQTQETVQSIQTIIPEVNGAVENMKECLDNMMEFLEQKVLSDYNEFMQVGDTYAHDASDYEQGMTQINDAVMSMVDAINNISVSINGINDMVKESAGGVQDIAEKTSTVVQKVDSASTFVDTSKESAENLNQIVGGFNLE